MGKGNGFSQDDFDQLTEQVEHVNFAGGRVPMLGTVGDPGMGHTMIDPAAYFAEERKRKEGPDVATIVAEVGEGSIEDSVLALRHGVHNNSLYLVWRDCRMTVSRLADVVDGASVVLSKEAAEWYLQGFLAGSVDDSQG